MIPIAAWYAWIGVLIFFLGFHAALARASLFRRVLALNLMGTGIFLFIVALAARAPDGLPDPVPHAMVLTGIVVSVSATALLLALRVKLHELDRRSSPAVGPSIGRGRIE
jgi:multicomponent Na+:H+ antiporter subunit C